ncbi:transketolase [Leadbettera azotonutricia]|uniref:Transketolase n=1 Tax=Leadbettera azotonutricia (strain ATCC BAA-888 / DSM 13862 / ZAS-9) TaxID=545695 RepID=F5YC30_LEAAZ|nr:transketolase [Leadbettera azotonutricia]AEF80813.1 transketolase [Leadbettera azotonutricia ZAS-9]
MDTKALEKVALSIRGLAMDAIQKANSGHPGVVLGAAELGAILYGELLRHDPSSPKWPDRDRFVLSAGHGSMFLYSLLHLSGYKGMGIDAIKSFRQVGSAAAGHPEYGAAEGIEMTTGPLGQGLATSVGMAIAETMLAARFNTSNHTIVDHYTYALAGDGCLQEGVSAEASSLAGHLGLGKLIVFYDSNKITIDGSTELSFTEDAAKRYEAYGWQVLKGSMYDFDGIAKLTAQAKAETKKPSLIILTSIIGKGAPTKQNTADIHGAPLGPEEIAAAKKALGIPEGPGGEFYVAPEAQSYFKAKQDEWKKTREKWQVNFDAWAKENPDKKKEWDAFYSGKAAAASLPSFAIGDKIATRTAGNKALAAIANTNLNLVGGAADLKGPNAVGLPNTTAYSASDRGGRYLHFGIREFGMAAIANGITLHGGFRSFCATFMVFSDYLRPALRLSALMKQPVIYVLTHDSIYVGEDGPTHQPIEHLAALRAIPNVRVLRPADAEETAEAWAMAMERTDGPICLALSRQNLTVFVKDDPEWKNSIRTGAYIAKKAAGKPDAVVIATGSEVSLALEAAEKSGKKVQVVSMISRELFESQPAAIRDAIVPPGARVIVCEAGISQGWERWAKSEDILSIDRFGESGPAPKVAEHLGFTSAALAAIISR